MAEPTPQATPRQYSERDAAMMKYVFDSWSDEREQLNALSMAIERCLTPVDPSDPQDNDNIQAWRLSQVLSELSSDVSNFSALKKMVFPDSQEVAPC
ncbi:MAG: hypothetical protein CO065_02375 [Comamonadaceae bacterium CG_4_9_14_0_8_um_filter_57_21]|nr:MAG: hypothetical protein CO065_02375 [Comamonadaceae bacterium CG_4_9_14_0_8_um_filter_57_21]